MVRKEFMLMVVRQVDRILVRIEEEKEEELVEQKGVVREGKEVEEGARVKERRAGQ